MNAVAPFLVTLLLGSVLCLPSELSSEEDPDYDTVAAPWHASLHKVEVGEFHKHGCGSTILAHKWLVTTAKCLDGNAPSDYEVLVGTNNFRKGGERFKIRAFHKHPHYHVRANDIGLIHLKGRLLFGDLIKPIEADWHEVPADAVLTLTGWGSFSQYEPPADHLRSIDVTYVSFENCKESLDSFLKEKVIDVSHLCTVAESGEGSCYGDSGSPLTLNGKLVGVASWGVPCLRGYPDVFTRVSFYHGWIRTTIAQNS